MSYGGNFGAQHVQLVYAEERLFFVCHSPAPLALHVGDEKHVRRVDVELKPLCDILTENGGSKRAKALTILHPQIQHLLHGWRAWVREDRTCAERARTKLHAPLHPADRFAAGERCNCSVDHGLLCPHRESRTGLDKTAFDIRLRERWPQKGPHHNITTAVGIALLAEKHVPDRESRPDRAAGITGARLHPDVLKSAVAQQLAIGDAV